MGYELSVEDMTAEDKECRELSEDELEAVSGGVLWFGDDAPDGHELHCFLTYYSGWPDFYYCNSCTYCNGGKGQKHEFEETTFMHKYYAFGGESLCHKCTLCGEIIPVEPRDGHR